MIPAGVYIHHFPSSESEKTIKDQIVTVSSIIPGMDSSNGGSCMAVEVSIFWGDRTKGATTKVNNIMVHKDTTEPNAIVPIKIRTEGSFCRYTLNDQCPYLTRNQAGNIMCRLFDNFEEFYGRPRSFNGEHIQLTRHGDCYMMNPP